MRRLAFPLLAVAIALLTFGCGGSPDGQGTAISMRYSQFVPALLEVPAGEPVTITLHNDDPIEHEWIVGPPEIHEVHRTGTEPYHDSRPTEVTAPAFSTRETTLIFADPGDYEFICHLPGHEDYGMVGLVRAVEG